MKKLLPFLLMLAIVLSIAAGCAQDEKTTPDPSDSQKPVTASDGPSEDPDDAPQPGEVKLPLVSDRVEFDIWSMAFDSSAGIEDANGSDAYQKLEELTNVHINWQHPPAADTATQFNLIVSSQDFPDCFQNYVNMYIGGLDKYIDDEIIIDVTDLVDRYAPNYNNVRSAEDLVKGTVTDSGRMPGLFGIKKTLQPSWMGPVTRADWLNDLGLEAPVTMDDYHDMLVKFRDEKGAEVPITINNTGLFQLFSQAWGLGVSFYHVDGVVKFGPIEPEFKEYLALMKKWYDEGLFEKEFYVVAGSRSYDTEYTLTGKVGVWNVAYNFMQTNLMLAAGDPTYDLVAIPCPVFNEGDIREIGLETYIQVDRFQGNIASITTQCHDPVTLVRWFDYLFTEEGGILGSYGIENKSFVFNDEGKPEYTELVYNNPDGLAAFNAMNRYAMSPNQVMLYDWERELLPNMYPQALAAPNIWDANYQDKRTLPSMMSISTEESQEYAAIMGDIDTLLSESIVPFIIGSKSLDEYDDFVNMLKALRIEDAIAIQQAALDRYNNR
ncbi:MAG: hypothetical protein ACOX1Q_08800 [Eubacteriales bacterium]